MGYLCLAVKGAISSASEREFDFECVFNDAE